MDVFEERSKKMDTTDSEASQEKLEAVVEQQDVPKERAMAKTIIALVDQYWDQYLAVGCCQQPKKWTQGNGGSQQKLVAAQGPLMRHAIPAPCKGHSRQGPGWDSVIREAPKGRTFWMRHWAQLECNNGIRD